MNGPMRAGLLLIALLTTLAAARLAVAMDVVRGGRPVAVVVVLDTPASASGKSRRGSDGRRAAEVLVDWVRKMTDAELTVADEAPSGAPAIYIGAAAVKAGLRLDDIDSPSHEGMRIRCDGRRLLLAGQNDTATLKAVCRLLEHWGCRYLMDHPLGEVFPRTKTLTLDKLDMTDKPGFLYRSIWGSNWSGSSLWKTWNGAGGIPFSARHAWGQYVARDLFKEHPEYFRMHNGQRAPSDWYCTSNAELRKVFAQGVIERIASGAANPSISPPDGRGYCECPKCVAGDDPKSLEPSSGRVSVTNRYVDFYQDVARRVRKASPESVLGFYCYADYTQAPTSRVRLEPNLCAWIAPIRYCRFHRIGDPNCPSRTQLAELLDGWSAAADKIAYRTYNYNLAECTVPFSLMSVWKHDIPYLKEHGCIGVNLETLTNWQIYGPHIYLSIRLAYDPAADAEAVMDDYFLKFYGPKAGPVMKEYWWSIDRAFAEAPSHAGSFFALHLVYTPEFLKQCEALLVRAAAACGSDKAYTARVEMAAEGLRNARQYVTLREAMNRGDFQAARRTYDSLLARSEAHQQTRLGNHYTVNYVKRFVGRQVIAGAEATKRPNRLLQVLPDRWRMTYDEADEGVAKGFQRPDFDDTAWQEVATYGNPLDAQGLPDRRTVLWYRTSFSLPRESRRPVLFFTEVDGDAIVYVNGRQIGGSEKKRTPFTVELGDTAKPGENVVAARVDHSSITELFLGGIVRPVLLIERGM